MVRLEFDDGETSSPPNKRNIDRLSALPDCLLIHILSFLGVEEASVTTVLSKRWQFLWAELPSLGFLGSSNKKIGNYVAWINSTLATRSAKYLEKFQVHLSYDKNLGRDVEAWVEFAVKNKVKEVSLEFGWGRDVFTVPEMLYSSSSLTYLFLEKCLMAPLKTIEWQSLTELAIEDVKLDQVVVDKILLGCPVLHSLNLVRCWGFSCLKLDSRSLYKLMVYEYQREALLEISAPYLHCLNISLGRKLLLRNIPSLVTAYINFNGCACDQDATPMEMNDMKDFLEMTRHVKELELGVRGFQVVSTLVVSGWQLPQSRRVSLKLSALRGYNCIISLLESSPNLETLEIRGYFNNYSRVESVSHDLDDDLVHLKRVKMYNFAAASIGGDPMLTIAKILLKRATILEEMIILSDPNDITTELLKLGRPLLTYPRSSNKALVQLQQLGSPSDIFPRSFQIALVQLQPWLSRTVEMYAQSFPPYSRKCLAVSANHGFWNTISGILSLLESSPFLRTLIICGFGDSNYDPKPSICVFGESNYDLKPNPINGLGSNLQSLEMVSIENLPNDESLLTLARILLKRATVLKKMRIVTRNDCDTSKIRDTLNTYMRSSLFCQVQVVDQT